MATNRTSQKILTRFVKAHAATDRISHKILPRFTDNESLKGDEVNLARMTFYESLKGDEADPALVLAEVHA